MTDHVKHICWIRATYEITKRGRKWLRGINRTQGQKPYDDKILINDISKAWRLGEILVIFALHYDEISIAGDRCFHNVSLIPVTEHEYYSAPPSARF